MGRQDGRETQTLVADSSMCDAMEVQSVELGSRRLADVAPQQKDLKLPVQESDTASQIHVSR